MIGQEDCQPWELLHLKAPEEPMDPQADPAIEEKIVAGRRLELNEDIWGLALEIISLEIVGFIFF